MKDNEVLEISLRVALCQNFKTILENNQDLKKFIMYEATFKQLMNVVFNQHYKKYDLSDELLEGIALYSIYERLYNLNESASDATIFQLLKTIKLKINKITTKYPGVKIFSKWVLLGISASLAATYVYNKILINYIRQCKNVDKKQLKNCIKKVKIVSLQKTIVALKTAQQTCNNLDKPENVEICKRDYMYQIEYLQDKIDGLSKK